MHQTNLKILSIELFDILTKECKANGFEVSEYWDNKEIKNTPQYMMLDTILQMVDWRGTRLELFRRIKKIGSNKNLSCREKQLLKKLVNDQVSKGSLDFDEISYYFPGKSITVLKQN